MRNQAIVNPPRFLKIRFRNPILGARYLTYEIQSKQLWDVKNYGEMIESAYNEDLDASRAGKLHEKLLGPLFYSLYGVYGSEPNIGRPMCIGDFKTLSAALVVLEGLGVISKKERTQIFEQADSEGMENAG